MVLHIDTDDLERLGLDMRELWVLTALRVLSSHKPWKGTYEDLKTKSQCGSKSSAQRIVEMLKEKGWVIETDEGFTVSSQIGTKPSQNGTDSSQNRTESSQNRTDSKEKSNKKENRIKEINKSESNSTLAHYLIILSNGYLHPQMHIKNMTSYYDANGWKSDDKAAVLTNWMRREQQFGNPPQMSEQAAAFVCDMVDCLPDYQESFCDALEDVQIEGNKVVLYVPKQRQEKLGSWLCSLDLSPLMNRYQVEISIRAAA